MPACDVFERLHFEPCTRHLLEAGTGIVSRAHRISDCNVSEVRIAAPPEMQVRGPSVTMVTSSDVGRQYLREWSLSSMQPAWVNPIEIHASKVTEAYSIKHQSPSRQRSNAAGKSPNSQLKHSTQSSSGLGSGTSRPTSSAGGHGWLRTLSMTFTIEWVRMSTAQPQLVTVS